jgi:general secretion pathway protein G
MWVGCGVVALVAFLGIIAALLIPNFLDALQKAKQKRTVADMMSLGAAVVSYWSDKGHYPQAEELAAELVPAYTSQVPTQDGWGRPLHYVCAEQEYSGCGSFVLASPGRDGVFERDDLTAYVPATIAPTDYDADIVYRDGAFVRRPAPATSTR